jgi:hypothetical protein
LSKDRFSNITDTTWSNRCPPSFPATINLHPAPRSGPSDSIPR